MADIGVPELLIILVIVLLVFGPSKIPDVAQSLGKGIRDFQRGMRHESSDNDQPSKRV